MIERQAEFFLEASLQVKDAACLGDEDGVKTVTIGPFFSLCPCEVVLRHEQDPRWVVRLQCDHQQSNQHVVRVQAVFLFEILEASPGND